MNNKKNNEKQEEIIKELKCSNCKKNDFVIVEGNDNRKPKKSAWITWIIFTIVALILLAICAVFESIQIFNISGSTIMIAAIYAAEKNIFPNKTHTKAICKNCGHIEYLD